MSLVIPSSVAYQDPVVSQPDQWAASPVEGPRLIPFEIMWATMGGAGAQKCVSFQVGNSGQGSAEKFSRINALSVDNSKCGCEVRFIFPDTGETITIPAYAPRTILPVFTNQTNFYLMTEGTVIASDVTRFAVHNTLPPPIAVPFTQQQNVAATGGLVVDLTTTHDLIPNTVSGTLENACVSMTNTVVGGSHYNGLFTLIDGASTILGQWSWASDSSTDQIANSIVWQVTAVHLRFVDGLQLTQSAIYGSITPDQTYISPNLYYRTP